MNVVFAARRVRREGEEGEDAARNGDDGVNGVRFSRARLCEAARALGAERGFEWDAGERVRRAFWVEVVEDAEGAEAGADAGAYPRVIRERPAGIDVNPLSALAGRMGTTMPREWAEDEEEEA